MKKAKRIIGAVLIFALLVLTLSACGKSSEITGVWYNEKGETLNVQQDGSYNYEGEYGTGTWKVLDDKKTIEFRDFYGETTNVELVKDDLGEKIKYHGYDFYKDSYPSDEAISENREKSAQALDAFAGISYEVSGVSPYCQLTVNTQGCSEEVQKYVTFELDKEKYANGDTAVVKAVLANNTGDTMYKLDSATANFEIKGQAEYISSVEGCDFTKLKAELADYITAAFANAKKPTHWGDTDLFNKTILVSKSITKVDGDIYLSSLKPNKKGEELDCLNRLSFTYQISWASDKESGVFYACISAVNVMKTADGTIKWGKENADDFDFVAESADGSIENCVTTLIMCNKDNYNITKVTV